MRLVQGMCARQPVSESHPLAAAVRVRQSALVDHIWRLTVGDTAVLRASDPWQAIPGEEFRDRQRRAREAAAAAGFEGVVVWSRGGAFMDMSADVLYLSNHYSQQPYLGDEAGIGSARSHGVCVIP